MKNSIIIVGLFLFSLASNAQLENETQLFFIRHAEKEKDGSNDPILSQKGQDRAIYWAEVFKNEKFDAIYSTSTSRTMATAMPIAENNDLSIINYDAKKIDIVKLANENLGKKILIVGHSNSTPTLVNTLLGYEKFEEIEHTNNSNLYIVNYSPTNTKVTLLYIPLY